MRVKDTSDVLASCVAVAADALFIFAGFMFATWLRFDSGLIPLFPDRLPPIHYYIMYAQGAGVATLLFLFIFQSLGLYMRPQIGTFGDKIPRFIHAIMLGLFLSIVLSFLVGPQVSFSRIVTAISAVTITVCVLLERNLLFRWELHLARRRKVVNSVIIVGTDSIAAHLQHAFQREPRLGSKVVAFFRTGSAEPHPDIQPDSIKGALDGLKSFIENNRVDQLILTDSSLGHSRMLELILLCEQFLVTFNLVPDLFSILTSSVDVQTLDDIPLLGVRRWPLDKFWNRLLKRAEDVIGAVLGLVLASPFILAFAILIKRSSPGPVFFKQVRCGEHGETFMLIKFRTMRVGAEDQSGPVWAVENDPRRTPIGSFLRRHNLDELPQFLNVLQGKMSLVGPRPERPYFVEQFKEDINRYMWRHVSKPGITGWAQVNGLRGNTDIRQRSKYDLYYLEHWALAFDFKILVRTLFSHENAY